MTTTTPSQIMPSIRRRVRRASPVPARVPGVHEAPSRVLPVLVTAALLCAVFYALVVSGGRCGGAAETYAAAPSVDAGDAQPDADARDEVPALLGGRRTGRARAPGPPPSSTSADAGAVVAGPASAIASRGASVPAEPRRFALSSFAKSQDKARPAPPPSTVLCAIPPNAILVLQLTASVSTHLGFFDTYRAYHHPCGHSLVLHLERTERIVINALSLGDIPACLANLTETAIEIEDRYALWIFPNGGELTPCSSPHALSTRSRDQRTPRQGSSASPKAPASSTPADDASRSRTKTGGWRGGFDSALRSTRGTR